MNKMNAFDDALNEAQETQDQLRKVLEDIKNGVENLWEDFKSRKMVLSTWDKGQSFDDPASVFMEFFILGFYSGKFIKKAMVRKVRS